MDATVLYLAFYLFMNLAAFAVIVAVQRERADGDESVGPGRSRRARDPWLAWPMTIAMLSLAGIPGTVGFIGKFQLIHALVNGGYTWLAIVLVIGSMISLGYYLRVIAVMWMERGPAPGPGVPAAVTAGVAWPRSPAARPRPTAGRRGAAGGCRAAGRRSRSPRSRCCSPPPASSSGSSRRRCSPVAHAGRALFGG